ncbi:AP2-like ethylene-responsive transcription factor [Iris pallida]|uniref:AP2-like ethylene-responsive transcription factor n=1 Tax=Iris pallida TaxID=29817 RepID=A0AAX6E094_IRIPA|nr:AP2-like ethylene-responsive transcription factor [Iris pallida]KAJ6845792.1 AP2-like ethylene-responsive transcription factor [Iris pallida]
MDATTEGKYAAVGFSVERKIDLTPYIKWWLPKKSRPTEPEEDFRRELRALECTSDQPTEPYQLPSLGLPQKGKPPLSRGLSASSILAKSMAFKNFVDKFSEKKDCSVPPLLFDGGVGLDIDRSVGVTMGLSEMSGQRTPYTLAPLQSEPSRTSWNPVDPDPVFWDSLVPPTSQPLPTTLSKSELGSSYPYQCQE